MKCLLLLLGALSGASAEGTSSPAAELVAAATLQEKPDADSLRRSLRDRDLAEGVFEILIANRVPITATLPTGRALRADLRASMLDAVAATPWWRSLVSASLGEPPSEAARITALEILGRVGTRSDRELLLGLAGTPESATSWAIERALRDAVAALVRRDEKVAGDLLDGLGGLGPAAAVAVVDGLGDAGTRAAVRALSKLLGDQRELRACILAALTRCAGAIPGPHDLEVRSRVRGYLRDRDERTVAQAALAVEALEDYESVPELIELLESDLVAPSAARALRSLAGVDFRRDATAWSLWHGHAVRRWEESSAWASGASFRSDDPQLQRGLRLLASSRFQRHERAELMVRALREGSPELAVYACRGLAILRSHAAVDELIDLLDASHEGLRAASYAALCSITEADMPPERDEWLEHYFSDPDPWN